MVEAEVPISNAAACDVLRGAAMNGACETGNPVQKCRHAGIMNSQFSHNR
jgi:hypothetical protein